MKRDNPYDSLVAFINRWNISPKEENRLREIIAEIKKLDESASLPSSPVTGEEDRETKRQPIEDALYATKRFLTTEATDLADGILDYLNDYGFTITSSLPVTGESEAIGERKFTLKEALDIWNNGFTTCQTKKGTKTGYFQDKFGIDI